MFIGKDRQYNRRFLRMCSHCLVEPTACTPASGWEKGQSLGERPGPAPAQAGVENQVGAANAVESTAGENMANPSLLAGLLYDGQGNRMSPSHANKKGLRYRYYVLQPLLKKSRGEAPEGLRIAAAEIEGIVIAGIGQFLSNRGRLVEALRSYAATAGEQERILFRTAELAAGWSGTPGTQLRPIIANVARCIRVRRDRIEIELSAGAPYGFLGGAPSRTELDPAGPDRSVLVSLPVRLSRIGQGKRLVIDAPRTPGDAGNPDPTLIKLLVRAHNLKDKLRRQPGIRLAGFSARENLNPSYAVRLVRLTFLAPGITRAILEGRQPAGFTAQKLITHSALPRAWPDQRRALGFA